MRTPLEIWVKEHQQVIEHADKLVELLAPSDIQAKLVHPKERKLRIQLAEHLAAFVDFALGHFRNEEKYLVPIIREHFNIDDPKIKEGLGCLSREHAQMHMFVERLTDLLPDLQSGDPLKDMQSAEVLRISYSVQSLLRHHCSKEEREVYSLIDKLPYKVIAQLMESIGATDDMPLDHLIKPLGEGESINPYIAENGESPEN